MSTVCYNSNLSQVYNLILFLRYIEFPASAGEPPKVLRGFEKVVLKPGESTTVSFELRPRDLSMCVSSVHSLISMAGVACVNLYASYNCLLARILATNIPQRFETDAAVMYLICFMLMLRKY